MSLDVHCPHGFSILNTEVRGEGNIITLSIENNVSLLRTHHLNGLSCFICFMLHIHWFIYSSVSKYVPIIFMHVSNKAMVLNCDVFNMSPDHQIILECGRKKSGSGSHRPRNQSSNKDQHRVGMAISDFKRSVSMSHNSCYLGK